MPDITGIFPEKAPIRRAPAHQVLPPAEPEVAEILQRINGVRIALIETRQQNPNHQGNRGVIVVIFNTGD